MTLFRESCQGPMALVGRKVPPHARGVFLPSGAGGWGDRGSRPTHGTLPRLPWASPGRCARAGKPASHLPSLPPMVQASAPLCWATGVSRDHCPAQEERQEVLGRGHLTSPLEGCRGREVPTRGANKVPAQEVSCWQKRQCFVCPPAHLTLQQPLTLYVWGTT